MPLYGSLPESVCEARSYLVSVPDFWHRATKPLQFPDKGDRSALCYNEVARESPWIASGWGLVIRRNKTHQEFRTFSSTPESSKKVIKSNTNLQWCDQLCLLNETSIKPTKGFWAGSTLVSASMCLEGGAHGENMEFSSPATALACNSIPTPSHTYCPIVQHIFFRPKPGQRLTMVGEKLKREKTLHNPIPEVMKWMKCQ